MFLIPFITYAMITGILSLSYSQALRSGTLPSYFRDNSVLGGSRGSSQQQSGPGSGSGASSAGSQQDTDVNYSCPICFDILTEPFMTKERFCTLK